ncbi:MAG TPA: GntG family PLP-dependent aldolase [Cytophagales bacterium]|nr:GntG family PLP-dependent aldolase [Cytophagales bacterium]
MWIDLRSDTVTKPTPEMLEAMRNAEVGDDVFDEDPTVKALEQKLAKMFSMEAGLFCPSGTMTNQIAIRLFTQPQSEVICDKLAHVHNFEGGGIAYNSFATTKLLDGKRGVFTAEDVLENIQPDNIHYPQTSLVVIENTVNKGGGSFYRLSEIMNISKVCKENNLFLHLDGARIFNALEETKEKPEEYGQYFDGISICLSKGLGAPIGSVLLASKENIKKGKRIRKVLGGGMRQAGFLAAAGIYALDNNIRRLKDDHKRAQKIEKMLSSISIIESIIPVCTNIVICNFKAEKDAQQLVNFLKDNKILVGHFAKKSARMVTHLDFNDEMLTRFEEVILKFKGKF